MEKLFKAFLEISEDAKTGTNQTGERFWWRVSRRYNANRLDGTIERNESMMRNAIGRANYEIQKFEGYYLQEQQSAASDTSEVDIIMAAMSTYHSVQYSTNHSSISTLGRRCAIIRSIAEAPRPPPTPPPNGRGRYPYPTPARMRWLASLPELTWVAPTPAQAVPNTDRKEGNRRRPTAVTPRPPDPFVPLHPHQLVVGSFGSNQYDRYVSDDSRAT